MIQTACSVLEQKKLKVPSIIIRRDADVRNGLNLPFTACLRGPPANVAVAKGLLAIVEPQVRKRCR
jgi:hypothetical protein